MATQPMVHEPECYAPEHDIKPYLGVIFMPQRDTGRIKVIIRECCAYCGAKVVFTESQESERRFHRFWKASMATYIATWEHRNGFWDDDTQ